MAQAGAPKTWTFRPIRALAGWTVGLIIAKMVALGAYAGSHAVALATGQAINFDGDDISGIALLAAFAGLAYLVTLLAAGVVSLVWIYRAACNTVAVRPGLAMTPGWAVGWFFVPFANLYKPYEYMRNVWVTAAGPTDGRYRASGQPVVAWWIVNLVGNVLTTASDRIPDPTTSSWLIVIGGSVTIVAAFLFMRIVQTVTRRQNQGDTRVADTF